MKSPKDIKPYLFHGVNLRWEEGERNAPGPCFVCGDEERFAVKIEGVPSGGSYNCFRCGGGRCVDFLRWLYQESGRRTKDYSPLVKQRGIGAETLKAWGVVQSRLTRHWLLPGYSEKGELENLYRWSLKDGKWLTLSTPGRPACLFGVPLWVKSKPKVYLCEGPWDAMAWYEALSSVRLHQGKYRKAPSPGRSLLRRANVLGVPGCKTFSTSWVPLFRDKSVYILYDNDHPREGQSGTDALLGAQRVARLLHSAKPKDRPRSISYLRWGEPEGYDPALAGGYDIRDLLREES